MKVTELMIGDYVKYQGHIYIIEEISAKGWVHLVRPEAKIRINMTSDYIIDLLEPIPLTKEILERNGFTQHITASDGYYDAPVLYMDEDDVLFHVSEDTYEDTWHVETFTDHNDNEYVLFNLCFVHELQHTLKICGLNELADNLELK